MNIDGLSLIIRLLVKIGREPLGNVPDQPYTTEMVYDWLNHSDSK